MRDKDLKKAISYHMKKSQSLLDPKQKSLSVHQARINYLEELSDLKCFGGKSFSATMMVGLLPEKRQLNCNQKPHQCSFCVFLMTTSPPQLQDRESTVTLLVGGRYGVSQVVNHKLSILTTLTEFSSITRVELLPESDKVSLVKIYLQDIKVAFTDAPRTCSAHDSAENTDQNQRKWIVLCKYSLNAEIKC